MDWGAVTLLGALGLSRDNGGSPTSLISVDGSFSSGTGTVTGVSTAGAAATNAGTSISLTCGNGNTSGAGGGFSFTSGTGGATGAGGGLTFAAGAGGATSGDGGDITFTTGDGGGGGAAGDFVIQLSTGTSQGAVILEPVTGGTAPELRFRENQSSGSNYTSFKAAGTLSGDTTYTWPDGYPAVNGYALTSTTTGTLSWSAFEDILPVNATVQTTDATVTTIATIATSTNNAIYIVDASFVGIDPTAGDLFERGMRVTVYRNGAGTLTLSNVNNYSFFSSDVSWDATADVSGSNILLRVQGDATNNTEWKVTGTVTEHS